MKYYLVIICLICLIEIIPLNFSSHEFYNMHEEAPLNI